MVGGATWLFVPPPRSNWLHIFISTEALDTARLRVALRIKNETPHRRAGPRAIGL